MRKILVAPLALLIAAASGAAAIASERLNIPAAEWKPAGEIIQKLAQKGLKVREIEADDGAYEFEATNDQGVKVEGHAHPVTGEILVGYERHDD